MTHTEIGQAGGGHPRVAIRPLWRNHCIHSGVLFPEPYVPQGLALTRSRGARGLLLPLPPHAEEFALHFARQVHARDSWALNNPVYRANFWRDWCTLLHPPPSSRHVTAQGRPRGGERLLSGEEPGELTDWDWAGLWESRDPERIRIEEEAERRGRGEGGDGTAWIDGVSHAMTANGAVDRPGIFRGRGADHPLNGRIRRRLGPGDVHINLSRGAPVPLPRWTDGGGGGRAIKWASVVHEPLVGWLARWKDPVTDHIRYVTLDRGAGQVQRHERMKFDMARRLTSHLPRVLAQMRTDASGAKVADVECADPRLKRKRERHDELQQLALCACVVEAFGIRAGEGGKVDGRSIGATSLRIRNLEVLEGEGRDTGLVRLRFVGKDQVCFDAVRPMGEGVARRLKALGRGRPRDARLFPRVEPPGLNRYLDCLLPGLTSKVMRTRAAGAALEARFSSLARAAARGRRGNDANKLAPAMARDLISVLGMLEAAAICNHRHSVDGNAGGKGGRCRGVSDVLPQGRGPSESGVDFTAALDRAWSAAGALVRGDGPSHSAGEETVVSRYRELELRDRIADVRRMARGMRLAPDTAKINYVDPRIVRRFCTRWALPIDAVYTHAQLRRFAWALKT